MGGGPEGWRASWSHLRRSGTSAVGRQEEGNEPDEARPGPGLVPSGEPGAGQASVPLEGRAIRAQPTVGTGKVPECCSGSGVRCRLPPSRRDFSHRAGERERGRTLLGEKGLVRAKQGVRVPATLAKMHPEALVPPKDPAAECGPGVSATAAGRVEGRTEEGDKFQKHTQTKKKKK